jgi:FlaA1/EpsC-like NDP-sugar epimerase
MSPLYPQQNSSAFNILSAAIMIDNVKSHLLGNVLVTGGGGFLGSHLIEAFVALSEVNQDIMTG